MDSAELRNLMICQKLVTGLVRRYAIARDVDCYRPSLRRVMSAKGHSLLVDTLTYQSIENGKGIDWSSSSCWIWVDALTSI